MPLILANDLLEVEIAPDRGADILQLTDLRTGTPVLTVSPTRLAGPRVLPGADSMTQVLAGYPGGWQLLTPNAGPERTHDGVRQGFHGEAAIASWTLVSRSADACELETTLATAPLHLRRRIALHGAELVVVDDITNLSPDPVQARIVQHPAFGAPFLDDSSYLVTSAGAMVTDADAPGTLASPDVVGLPGALLPAGTVAGSIRLPGPGSGASLFAALTDLDQARVTFCSPTRGFGITLSWDAEVLPHAWFWIEANAGSGWPWFRRLYAVAVEPANILPGEGAASDGRPRGGPGATIAPGATVSTTTRLTRVALGDAD